MPSRLLNEWRELLGVSDRPQVATVISVSGASVVLATRDGVTSVQSPIATDYAPGDRVTVRSGVITGRARRAPKIYVV